MNSYRVYFYKDLLNSDGHRFKCLQREIDVLSDSPSGALVLAEQQIDNDRLDADRIEVMHLPSDRHDPGQASAPQPAQCKHTWSRLS